MIFATGEAVISCCGISLPPLEAEETDALHDVKIETVEDEYYVSVDHEMTKDHSLSFLDQHDVDHILSIPTGAIPVNISLFPWGNKLGNLLPHLFIR